MQGSTQILRRRFDEITSPSNRDCFSMDVEKGLTSQPKKIPSRWLYDAAGSGLFSRITEMEEYDLTRNETWILEHRGRDIARALGSSVAGAAEGTKWRVVELGAGDGTKTVILLRALLASGIDVQYWPVDVSSAALTDLCRRVSTDLPRLSCHPVVGDNLAALSSLAKGEDGSAGPLLLIDLGSSVGNRSREELATHLAELRSRLRPGDAMLVGFDMEKDTARLIRAYDDQGGITREFNLNLLRRMNRELGADFHLSRFTHHARWNEMIRGMESWLVSSCAQTVSIDACARSFYFNEGEGIRTEISLKFNETEIGRLAKQNGFECYGLFSDFAPASGRHQTDFVDALWVAREASHLRPALH